MQLVYHCKAQDPSCLGPTLSVSRVDFASYPLPYKPCLSISTTGYRYWHESCRPANAAFARNERRKSQTQNAGQYCSSILKERDRYHYILESPTAFLPSKRTNMYPILVVYLTTQEPQLASTQGSRDERMSLIYDIDNFRAYAAFPPRIESLMDTFLLFTDGVCEASPGPHAKPSHLVPHLVAGERDGPMPPPILSQQQDLSAILFHTRYDRQPIWAEAHCTDVRIGLRMSVVKNLDAYQDQKDRGDVRQELQHLILS